MQCSVCQLYSHPKCLGAGYELSGCCRVCLLSPSSECSEELTSTLSCLQEIVKSRGLKIIHQNIQSLTRKIDELRRVMSELKSGIHLMALTETLANKQILDAEIDILGYKIFRRHRGSKGGGVAVFAKNDLLVSRRSYLGVPDVEGLWLEIKMPNSRGFLVGTFYRPPSSSKYHDKYFIDD